MRSIWYIFSQLIDWNLCTWKYDLIFLFIINIMNIKYTVSKYIIFQGHVITSQHDNLIEPNLEMR